MNKYFFFMVFSILSTFHIKSQMVLSPSGSVSVKVDLSNEGVPRYSISYKNKSVIQPSSLGFVLKDGNNFNNGFEITNAETSSVDKFWNPVWGEVKTIRNHYNELKISLRQTTTQRLLTLVFRVFDDGVGFRYEIPRQPAINHFIIEKEETQFNFGKDHTAFWIPGDYNSNEYFYHKTRLSEIDASVGHTITEISAKKLFDNYAVQTPLLLKSDDGIYINLHEAALVNYSAMNLVLDKNNFSFTSHLVPDAIHNAAYLQAPATTPWRTIILSDKATDLLSSKTILNLNEPSKINDISWIKPQKMIGIWWEMHVGKSSWDKASGKHGATTANTKRYIDFAAKHGFNGILVEGWNEGWEDWFGTWKEDVFDFVTPYPDYDINYLSNYALEKGVKLIMHHETSSSVTNYERWMEKAYQFMKKHGMEAVKTGYVGYIIPRGEWHDGQWMVNHYNRVLEKTAEYKIMVDAHEPVRPTGLHRTWPNFLTCEAARGNEFNAWSQGNPPEHETILPFTRLMGGPMDYTPGIFKIKMNHYNPTSTFQVHTTLAKQLALYVTMYSPLQMAADLIENYEARPDAFQFIKDVPVDWDDTKYITAEPGDYVVVARKEKGKENWFVGAITDEETRTLQFSLDFLNKEEKYIMTMYNDADDSHWKEKPESYIIENFIVTASTILKLKMAPGGGTAISIKPATIEDTELYKKYKVK
ncbi:MAG: glycoside hydrolase family 97 protein [Saprospiraceae bacterium]|nr:glycoside hydrolase family 97 protein [Saprospiraceae bacterium]